jgi:hypothetical protein
MDSSKPDDKPPEVDDQLEAMSHSQSDNGKKEDEITDAIELDVLPTTKRVSSDIQTPAAEEAPKQTYMTGWRLYILIFGLCLSLLLSTLETTIVSTSLVSITNALSGFENRDWVVTSYLLTYTGFLVIYAKFSDIFGAKFMILLALLVFTVFSIVCGAATGMTEL